MIRVRHEREEDAAYAKLYDDAVARLREGLARSDASPSSRREIEAEVKRAFKREWRETEAALAQADRDVAYPDY